MSRFGFLFVLCMGWQYAAGSPVVTEYEYEYDSSKEAGLRLHIVPAVWSDAALRCQLEGGVLATPTSSAMVRAMLDAMKEHNTASSGVFIGVTDRLSKGDFKSLDGANLADSLEWAAGEPDNADDAEHCVALTAAGTLADVSCTRVLPYFCRKSTQASPSTENPTMTYISYEGDYQEYQADHAESLLEKITAVPSDPRCGGNVIGYEYEPRTGSCYKFHRTPLAWLPALAKCHDEGGYLAVINSEVESTVLKELFEKNPSYMITGRCNPNYATIGFRKGDDGEWATIHGDTPAEAGFDKWSPGEPNSFMGPENCGSIYRDGLLNDSSCTVEFPFICEITP